LPNITNSYISVCKNEAKTDPYCPVFLVRDILEKAEPDPFEREQMLLKVIFLFWLEYACLLKNIKKNAQRAALSRLKYDGIAISIMILRIAFQYIHLDDLI
jgi:hypothetical protein